MFNLTLVAILSDRGLGWSESAALTQGGMQWRDDGSGRIIVIRSKTDIDAQGAVVVITPAAMKALSAMRPVGVAGDEKVFGIADRPAGEGDRQGCRISGLGVLQRPQRAGGHGPAHAPKRRPHPRDRTPGTLERGGGGDFWRRSMPMPTVFWSWPDRRRTGWMETARSGRP